MRSTFILCVLPVACVLLGWVAGCSAVDGKSDSPVPGDTQGSPRTPQELRRDYELWAKAELERVKASEKAYARAVADLNAEYEGRVGEAALARVKDVGDEVAVAIEKASAEMDDVLALASQASGVVSALGGPVGAGAASLAGVVLAGWYGRKRGIKTGTGLAEQIVASIESLKAAYPEEVGTVFESPRAKAILDLAQSEAAKKIVDRVQSRTAA